MFSQYPCTLLKKREKDRGKGFDYAPAVKVKKRCPGSKEAPHPQKRKNKIDAFPSIERGPEKSPFWTTPHFKEIKT